MIKSISRLICHYRIKKICNVSFYTEKSVNEYKTIFQFNKVKVLKRGIASSFLISLILIATAKYVSQFDRKTGYVFCCLLSSFLMAVRGIFKFKYLRSMISRILITDTNQLLFEISEFKLCRFKSKLVVVDKSTLEVTYVTPEEDKARETGEGFVFCCNFESISGQKHKRHIVTLLPIEGYTIAFKDLGLIFK